MDFTQATTTLQKRLHCGTFLHLGRTKFSRVDANRLKRAKHATFACCSYKCDNHKNSFKLFIVREGQVQV